MKLQGIAGRMFDAACRALAWLIVTPVFWGVKTRV